jgi:excisionase family DNA binding protein
VLALIEAGDLPARRLGQDWRLSRTAVLAWLRGGRPGTGEPA